MRGYGMLIKYFNVDFLGTKKTLRVYISRPITLAGTPSEKLRVEIFRIIKLS